MAAARTNSTLASRSPEHAAHKDLAASGSREAFSIVREIRDDCPVNASRSEDTDLFSFREIFFSLKIVAFLVPENARLGPCLLN
jgi:hypothetical protein